VIYANQDQMLIPVHQQGKLSYGGRNCKNCPGWQQFLFHPLCLEMGYKQNLLLEYARILRFTSYHLLEKAGKHRGIKPMLV
jgi:hypothetical protein